MNNLFLFDEALEALNSNNYDAAKKKLIILLERNSNHSDAHHLLAITLALMNDHKNAISHYYEAIKLKPNDAQIFSNLASSLSALGKNEEAFEVQKKSLEIEPNNYEFLYNAGNILCALNLYEDSIPYYQNAIQLNSLFEPAYNNLGKAHFDLKNFEKSIIYFDKALEINPVYIECLNNKAICLKELKNFDEALFTLEIALSQSNNHPGTLSNIGIILCQTNKYLKALDYFELVTKLSPNYAEGWLNKGVVFNHLKNFRNAIFCFNKAIDIKNTYVEAWANKASSLIELKKFNDALACYQHTLSLKPDFEWIFGNMVSVRMKLGIWNNHQNNLNKLIGYIDNQKKVLQPFISLFLFDDPNIHKCCAQIYTSSLYPPNQQLGALTSYQKKKKIRLGYFSADFGSHAVSSLIVEFLELHDKNLFEIIGFSNSENDKSDVFLRIRNSFNEFIQINELSDLEVAQLTRKMQIDIAIDLGCFTGSNRFGPFSYRLAPIQVNFLGYPGTSGTDYIDYIIGDHIIISPDCRDELSEKVVFLPNCYQPNDRKRKISEKFNLRSDFSLPDSSFVFCCFNNNFKIQPDIFSSWMKILLKVEDSVLWLLKDDDIFQSNIIIEAQKFGIDSNRLIFANRLPADEHLGRHCLADLFLDTFPYNAHTTASDALWAGLPVLTLQGKSFASRVASSLLNAIGLPELITNSQDEYENFAIELALNKKKLSSIRDKLKHNRLSMPLFNTPQYTKHLEVAYQKMYECYHSGIEPSDLHISN